MLDQAVLGDVMEREVQNEASGPLIRAFVKNPTDTPPAVSWELELLRKPPTEEFAT
jgi:hypothetical protein